MSNFLRLSRRERSKTRRYILLQIAATGEEALENLEELEIIFGGVSELGSLERCTRLRSLTRAAEMRVFFLRFVCCARDFFSATLPTWKPCRTSYTPCLLCCQELRVGALLTSSSPRDASMKWYKQSSSHTSLSQRRALCLHPVSPCFKLWYSRVRSWASRIWWAFKWRWLRTTRLDPFPSPNKNNYCYRASSTSTVRLYKPRLSHR